MKLRIWKWVPFAILLLLTACKSSQSAMEGTSHGTNRSEAVYIGKVVANSQKEKCVTAKINMDLNALDKELSVNGRLRMKRDEVIQLSLSLLGFEVGRMEFTPQQVLVVDRVNRQYVRASYTDVSFLQQAGLDFYALQSLFWNELFIPGQQTVGKDWSRFKYEEEGNYVTLALKDAPKLEYTFLTQVQQALLSQVKVQGKHAGDEGKFEWNYDRFTRLDNRYFPTMMECKVSGLGKQASFTLSLSRLDNDDRWDTVTKISSRYRERRVEEILERLMGM